MNFVNKKRGMTIVEVLIAIQLLLVFVTGVGQLSTIGTRSSESGKFRAQAAQLAAEGMEAIYAIRQAGGIDFSPSPASDSFITEDDEYYTPAFSGGTWSLGSKSNTSPAPTMAMPYEKYVRTVRVEKVMRIPIGLSCTGEIVDSDPQQCDDYNSRRITVVVEWNEDSGAKEYSLVSIFSNI